MTNTQKLKQIAQTYYENETDDRPLQVIYSQMLDFAEKGWINQAFIDGAYNAIVEGKTLLFSHDPEQNMYGYLAGSREAIENFLASDPDKFEYKFKDGPTIQ